MSLPKATFGRDGPQVNRLGLGLMGLSGSYGAAKPDPERMAFLDHAYEQGERFWDSSDAYYDSEDLIGRWFKANPGKRDNIFLATKFGIKRGKDSMARLLDSSPDNAKACCAKSLERLGIDTIDLYYCHRIDDTTPIEHTVQAMVELKKQGKIKYLGLSEVSSSALRRACKVHHISAVQVEYSPFALEIESPQFELLKTCRELGVAVVAYSPLGRGMLTGALKSRDDLAEEDFRRHAPRFSEENFPKNLELVDKITDLARQKNVTSSQLTLAWLMAQGLDIFPIPGTTKTARLDENLGSLKVQLSENEIQNIREAVEKAEIAGTRYHALFMHACFRDSAPLNE